jgi:type II secretory pathway component PulM
MNRQLALGMLLTLTLGAAVYEWAWLPYRHAVSSLEASVQDAQRAFDWAETTIAQIKRAPNVGEGGRASMQTLEQSLTRSNLRSFVTRIEPRDGQVLISFEAAIFSSAIKWLALAEGELGLEMVSMALSAGSAPGTADGTVLVAGVQL